MSRVRFPRCVGVFAAQALILCVVDCLTAVESLEKEVFHCALQVRGKDVRPSRDREYWRAPERTPGPLVCSKPAATDVWVSCDRWPDGSDVRRFGLDAIRLSGAKTEHEKALAVYQWVRRWMIGVNKEVGLPTEKLVAPHRKDGYVDQALKLLNVYGTHWCDGQARVVEAVWRALGYRAEKIVRGGHTVVGCHYRDHDGIKRWHVLDVSHSAFAFDRSRQRLLSPDELSTRWYAFYYQWVFCPHNDWDDHRMDLAFRMGEKLERIWGNWGKPYQDSMTRDARLLKKVPQRERGPYTFTYSNGRWTYSPDLSEDDWTKGLAEPPVNLEAGKLQPETVGKAATAVWHFRTPYIVSDAEVKLALYRKSTRDHSAAEPLLAAPAPAGQEPNHRQRKTCSRRSPESYLQVAGPHGGRKAERHPGGKHPPHLRDHCRRQQVGGLRLQIHRY